MKRPQSAKPGYKGNWGQAVQGQGYQQYQQSNKINQRKNVKLLKPDLTTNDFARILPKAIYQDKQRLYSQTLQLKQSLNQTMQQNMRLKTRIAILQKQKNKLTRNIDGTRQSNNNIQKNNINSRVNTFNNKNSDKENMIVTNLKKMIRQKKQQNDYLNQQNAKIKKTIKYTKINELEIQRKMMQQQNKRVIGLLEQMNSQLADQQHYQKQINQLRRALEHQQDANRQLNEANLKYMDYSQQLEEKLQSETQKFQNKQNKYQRDLAITKRKMNEALKQVQDLRRQLNLIKQQSNNSNQKKATKLTRPISSNPYKNNSGIIGMKTNSTNSNNANKQTPTPVNKQNVQQMKIVQIQNQKLKDQLSKTKQRLQQTQRKMVEQRQRTLSQKQNQSVPVKAQSNKKIKQAQKQSPVKNKQKSEVKQLDDQYKSDDNDYDNYENEFDQHEQLKKQSKIKQKKQENSQIDQYRKDFQAEQEQEQIFAKDQQKQKKKRKSVEKKKKTVQSPQAKKKTVNKYKPDKKILTQIKQLLSYRMKAQRYPYEQLKKDIMDANQKSFTNVQLKSMLTNEPFYLNQNYSKAFIQYCFEKESIPNVSSIGSDVLLQKLRKVIEDFQLLSEKQQEQMLLRIAQMVTEYPQQLQTAFEKIKNGEDTVAKNDLIDMFKKLELDANYIEIIIQELSLCSSDLNHLNFHGFFERFYVENIEGLENGRIDQEQIESSSQEVSKHLKYKDSSRLKKVNKQFEDNYQDDLAIDEGEKISLGNQGNYHDNDEDIVSDDGPI